MSQLLEYLVENEPSFRKARLPALYSDFHAQRTLNPDGYQANIAAWRRALGLIVRSGLGPATRSATPSLLVLHSDERLLRALESKQYGIPLALGAVLQEALAEKDLVPLAAFRASKESIYNKHWSVWNIVAWAARQAGLSELWRVDKLPKGEFVVVANAEEAAKSFSNKQVEETRLGRTFSKTHFCKIFAGQVFDGKTLSKVDLEVLLTFLSRDKGLLLYDGKTVRIKSFAADEPAALTDEDASIAQLKELLAYLTHQTSVLEARVDELALAARQAVAKGQRTAALAALRAKKTAEATLAQRAASAAQLEDVAARIERAADSAALVRVMEGSAQALASLNAQAGGAAHVEAIVDRLRGQMEEADEVESILAEAAGPVIDETAVDAELAALEELEKEEALKAERAVEEKNKEIEAARHAEETRKRLDEVAKTPQQPVGGKDAKEEPHRTSIDALAAGTGTVSLEEKEKNPQLEPTV